MKDPLSLQTARTPEMIREQRAAPLASINNIHRRLVANECADSVEAKVTLLAHLIYLAYADIKDTNTK